ncbi:MAG TPA: DUF2567 domain-containing protein [Streptomyces sp.]|uniref:DUF2567 domain-containing protein n=1 Tax=Streptomyces sp. TaxID=1931 RepID=UPI002D305E9E|nr:DUF2567 domain-containing protein [Streptomyces sp.]HZG02993.1 DUF2567 domain-containing protein [Streptomyces sp.]
MTAPTPPSPQHGPSASSPSSPSSPSSYDPWGSPPGGGDGPAESDEGASVRQEVRDAVLVTVATAAAGAVLGLLWLWLAPRVPLISDGTAVYLQNAEGEEPVGVDGTFVLLALGMGALTGAAVFLARRRGGVGAAVGLAVGAVLGSLLAWRLGVWLGPEQDVVAHARAVGEGKVFDAPLELKAKGALLAWPFAALVTHLALMALFGPRDPEPHPLHPAWGPQPVTEEARGTGTGEDHEDHEGDRKKA